MAMRLSIERRALLGTYSGQRLSKSSKTWTYLGIRMAVVSVRMLRMAGAALRGVTRRAALVHFRIRHQPSLSHDVACIMPVRMYLSLLPSP
jgi:hypothetical protein